MGQALPSTTLLSSQTHHHINSENSVATTRQGEAAAILKATYRIASHPAEFGAYLDQSVARSIDGSVLSPSLFSLNTTHAACLLPYAHLPKPTKTCM